MIYQQKIIFGLIFGNSIKPPPCFQLKINNDNNIIIYPLNSLLFPFKSNNDDNNNDDDEGKNLEIHDIMDLENNFF